MGVRGKCVVVRDADGRSSSLLVSSLAMLMMSEEFRTREGLEQVILGVWVSLGFPFNKHHTLTSPAKQSTDKHHSLLCPLFLIFLDSVHQLCHQFPAHFSFLSEYLVSVWDTCLLPVTQSFLFDCEHDQHVARSGARSPVSEMSAFNWSHQFSQEQISSWENPLYGVPIRPTRGQQSHTQSINSMIIDMKIAPLLPESRWDNYNKTSDAQLSWCQESVASVWWYDKLASLAQTVSPHEQQSEVGHKVGGEDEERTDWSKDFHC